MKILELRENQLNNTLVFETLGQPEKEREFKLSNLKSWGFDLVFGKIDGKETFYTMPEGQKKPGDTYQLEGHNFKVEELLNKLPENSKVFAHIKMHEGTAILIVELKKEGEEDTEVLQHKAGTILLPFLKKQQCTKVIEALRNLGSAAELRIQNGQEGKPLPYNELPPHIIKFLKEAKKIEKTTEFGRLALAYFGQNKDKSSRFQVSWFLPTISLFDQSIVKNLNLVLDFLK